MNKKESQMNKKESQMNKKESQMNKKESQMNKKESQKARLKVLRDLWDAEGNRIPAGTEVEMPLNRTVKGWIKSGVVELL